MSCAPGEQCKAAHLSWETPPQWPLESPSVHRPRQSVHRSRRNGNGNGNGNGNTGNNGNGNGNGNGGTGGGPIQYESDQYYYHGDQVGSTNYVTDSTGEVYEHLEYFPFGETWIHQHTNTNQRLAYNFIGKELDESTGLYYFGARYFDPRANVWISPDPILVDYLVSKPESLPNNGVFSSKNLNLYAYSYQNPISLKDPDGNIPVDTVWDAASIVYDVGKIGIGYATGNRKLVAEGALDLAADSAALFVPYVPAGSTKVARAAAKRFARNVNQVASLSRNVNFKGLIRNKGLNTLTGSQVQNAFKKLGFKVDGHAIARLKQKRTSDLGVSTLGDLEKIFQKGNFVDAGRGDIAIQYKGVAKS